MTVTRSHGKTALDPKVLPQKFSALKASENLVLAIPLSISGDDATGTSFTENTQTVLINRLGCKLLAGHELAEGAELSLTILTTRRSAAGRVIWIGEKSGTRWEVGVEIDGAASFWGVQFPAAAPARPAAPSAAAPSAAPSPQPQTVARAAGSVSDVLTESLRTVIETAVETNLRPSVEFMSERAQRELAEHQAEMLDAAQQQLETAVTAHSERLEMRAIDIVTRNEQALERSISSFADSAEQALKRRQREYGEQMTEAARRQLLEIVLGSKAELQKEASTVLSGASGVLRSSVQQHMAEVEAEFSEQCRQRTERLLSCHLEEAGNSLANGVRQLEDDIQRISGTYTSRFSADLEHRCEKVLAEVSARMERKLEETAERVAQSFTRHLISELKERQAEMVQETSRAIEAASEQNIRKMRAEMGRMVRALGQVVESDPES